MSSSNGLSKENNSGYLPRMPSIVPQILIGMYFRDGIQNPDFFMANICPHLVAAVDMWYEEVEKIELNDEARVSLRTSLEALSPALVSHLWIPYLFSFSNVHAKERLGLSEEISTKDFGYDVAGYKFLLEKMKEMEPWMLTAEIGLADQETYTSEEVEEIILAFTTMLLYKPWEKFFRKTGIPFAMEFDQAIPKFPEYIELGELTLRKVFDRFLLPTFVNQSEYRNLFYKYFAEQYERSSDMKIKEAVFKHLFELMPGDNISVLDAGCGTGLAYTKRPQDRSINMLGVDASPEMVSIATSKGELASLGKIEDIELPAGDPGFDYAMLSFVDYWLLEKDRVAVFKNLKLCLKNGGKAVFNVHKPYYGWEDDYRKSLIEECGYRSVEIHSDVVERTGGGVYTAYYVVAET